MQRFTLMRFWGCIGFLCLSSHIEVLCLPLISGSHFRRVSVLKLSLAQHFNHIWWTCRSYRLDPKGYVEILCYRFKGYLDDHLPLIEFTYNNNYNSIIQIALYDDLYRPRCWSHVGLFKDGEAALIEPNSVLYAMEKVQLNRHRLKTTESR